MSSRDGILALVSDPDVSHTAWRIARPFQRLREIGVDAQVLSLGPAGTDGVTWSPEASVIGVPESIGVVVLPRVTVPPKYREHFLAWRDQQHRAGVAVVCETDDDTVSEAWAEHICAVNAPWANLSMTRDALGAIQRQSEQDRWILSQVDGVTVSTEHLASIVRQYASASVITVPNAIDVDAFQAGLVERPIWGDAITIGWAAGMRPEADAAPVAEAWRRIAARYPDVLFVVAGWQPKCLVAAVPADRLVSVPYRSMAEYPSGMQVSIGCCSAADTAFNRSRGPGKAWEYALAGAAVVGSETVYGDCLYRARAVRVAETADEWEYLIYTFVVDARLRAFASGSLCKYVEHFHSLTGNLHRWADAYRTIRASMEVPA